MRGRRGLQIRREHSPRFARGALQLGFVLHKDGRPFFRTLRVGLKSMCAPENLPLRYVTRTRARGRPPARRIAERACLHSERQNPYVRYSCHQYLLPRRRQPRLSSGKRWMTPQQNRVQLLVAGVYTRHADTPSASLPHEDEARVHEGGISAGTVR